MCILLLFQPEYLVTDGYRKAENGTLRSPLGVSVKSSECVDCQELIIDHSVDMYGKTDYKHSIFHFFSMWHIFDNLGWKST